MTKRERSEPTAADWRRLTQAARRVRANAHAPHSKFKVGAALLTRDGRIFTGCNVENASFGLTVCAERNAVGAAVAAGAKRFTALAVVSTNGVAPCGACRQVLAEFAPQMPVRLLRPRGGFTETTVDLLLPSRFKSTDLPR